MIDALNILLSVIELLSSSSCENVRAVKVLTHTHTKTKGSLAEKEITCPLPQACTRKQTLPAETL